MREILMDLSESRHRPRQLRRLHHRRGIDRMVGGLHDTAKVFGCGRAHRDQSLALQAAHTRRWRSPISVRGHNPLCGDEKQVTIRSRGGQGRGDRFDGKAARSHRRHLADPDELQGRRARSCGGCRGVLLDLLGIETRRRGSARCGHEGGKSASLGQSPNGRTRASRQPFEGRRSRADSAYPTFTTPECG